MIDFNNDIEACLQVMQEGGIILYPTDTVWGLGCDATNEKAVEKIYALKQRNASQAMIVLVASERDVLQYITQPNLQVFEYIKHAAKPTTVIYDGAIGLADNLIAADGSIAIRICEDVFCKHLIKRLRKPLVSTSANISGKPTPAFFNEVDEEIIKGVDYVVRYRQDDISPRVSSSIIKWGKDGSLVVIRP
jgi:L-threonylcarbamoyladenylate synthase